jgi:hypothetical protein
MCRRLTDFFQFPAIIAHKKLRPSGLVLAQPFGQQGGYLLRLLIGCEVAGIGQQMVFATARRRVEGFHLSRRNGGVLAAGNG